MKQSLETLISDVEKLAKLKSQADLASKLFQPLASVMSLGIIPPYAAKDPAKLKYIAMPDTWLGKIAVEPELSEEGLAFLASVLTHKKKVMISDAVTWANIEKKNFSEKQPSLNAATPSPAAPLQHGAGAGALLARASLASPRGVSGMTGRVLRSAGTDKKSQ